MKKKETALEFLKSREYELRFGWIDKGTEAITIFDKQLIVISPLMMMATVFIHEYVHIQNPEMTESKVIKKTNKILNKMSRKEIQKLGGRLIDYWILDKGRKK